MKRYRKRLPVEQQLPTFQLLIDRYNSGLTSRKEITRRVEVGIGKLSDVDKRTHLALSKIAITNGWIKGE